MIAVLFATLRTQLQDANKPGLAGVRALEGAAQTVAALEDAVRLMEQRYADKEGELSAGRRPQGALND